MTISSGHLDSLLNMGFTVQTLANLTYQSGTAANGGVQSVTAKTGITTYGSFDSMKVTSVNDSNNTIVVTGYETSGGGYYGGGTTTAVPWNFAVVGKTGNDLLLAANGAAALTSVPASTVASYIQGGNTAALNNDLFVFAIDGSNVGTDVTPSQTLTFSSFTQAAGPETVAMVTASAPSSPVAVSDSAANVQNGLDALQAAGSNITGISLTDSGTPTIQLSDTQFNNDSAALAKISGNYSLSVSGVAVARAAIVADSAHVGLTTVSDSSANVFAALDGLQGLINNGHQLSIGFTDSGSINFTLSPSQLAADSGALKAITSAYSLTVPAGTSAATIAGLDGHATTVTFTGNAGQYTVSASNGVVSVANGGVTDQLSNISAIKFADLTEIVAAAPGPANAVTTGNITELYSAVLSREPDVGGLAFYQNFLKSNPNTSLQTFATFFLNSSEYTSSHTYPQTTAGDQQFITDSYQNLLHRTPSASEVSFYETNVLAPAVAGLTAGTQAYANAQLQAHATMLVYFSASSEFLGDVQITAANPASASHWLLLA